MKKGFTLIELLAVIVILAIIAVITVPKVAEMIDSSRMGAAEDSFYGSIKSAELGWAKALEKDKTLMDATCSFSNDGTATCSNSDLTISSSGKNASAGKISIDEGGAAEVYAEDSLFINGYYCCGNSSKTYCKRNSAPEASETDGVCKSSSANNESDSTVVYRWTEDILHSGDSIEGIATTTDPSTLGRSYYLKHKIDSNNLITESYVCFITDTEYCLQGGDSSYYQSNVAILRTNETWFNNHSGSCTLEETSFGCYTTAVLGHVIATSSGGITILSNDSGSCFIDSYGIRCTLTGGA